MCKKNIDLKVNNKKTFKIKKWFFRLKRQRELKHREIKIKREMKKLFFKPIIVFIDDMDKFEQ